MLKEVEHFTINCVLIGSESLTIRCGQLLLDAGHDIVLVVTSAKIVVEWAEGNRLRLANSLDAAYEILKKESFDYLFSIANLKIIPEHHEINTDCAGTTSSCLRVRSCGYLR